MANNKNQGRFLKKNVKKRMAQHQETPKPATRKAATSKRIKPVVLVFTALAVCVSIIASVFFLGKLGISFKLPSRTIASGVSVAGVDVGAMTKSQAADAVSSSALDAYATQTMVVSVLDKQLEIAPSVAGVSLNVDAAVKDALSYGTEENPATTVDITPYLTLNTEAIQNLISGFSVNFPTEGIAGGYEIATEVVDDEERAVLIVTVGSIYYDFSADELYDVILKAYNSGKFNTVYTCNQIIGENIDLDAIYEEYCIEPVDATWDSETHEVIESVVGYCFDLESAKEALAAAQPGDVLTFPIEEIQPEVTTEDIDGSLFQDVLGTYTAHQNSSSNRATNLRLACEALDGLILYPGDTFSYNGTLGERTPEKGYKPAAAYSGSETVQSYGGGICQPSSALYYCALMADLEIVQRHCHTFASSYVPMGMDATVDWSGPDLKLRNNFNYPIRIDAEADGGTVTITLMGTDEKDYYVKMEYEIWSVSSPKTVEEEVSPNSGHKDGEVKTSPYTGYTVQTFKLKYDKETDALISREEEAHSVYSKRDKVVYKIKSEAPEETTPTEPSTTPTEPSTTPTEPSTTPTEPSTTPTEPSTTPTEPSTEPSTEATEPTTTETQPVGEAGGEVAIPGENG